MTVKELENKLVPKSAVYTLYDSQGGLMEQVMKVFDKIGVVGNRLCEEPNAGIMESCGETITFWNGVTMMSLGMAVNVQHKFGEPTRVMQVGLDEAAKLGTCFTAHVESTNKVLGQVFGVLWQVTEEGRADQMKLMVLNKKVMDGHSLSPAFADP